MVFATFWHGYFSFCRAFAIIWPCSPSILHGICDLLALQALICMVFATFWYFNRSCGFLEIFFRLSFRVSFKVLFRVSFRVSLGFHFGFHLGFHLRVSYQDFFSGFPNVHVGFFGASLGFYLRLHLGFLLRFHLGFFRDSVWVWFRVSLRFF